MSILSDRQRKALAGLYYIRKGEAKKYKTKRPFGSDTYIAAEAHVLVFNPHRMPSEFVLLFNEEQQKFFFECEETFRVIKAGGAALAKQAMDEVKEELGV